MPSETRLGHGTTGSKMLRYTVQRCPWQYCWWQTNNGKTTCAQHKPRENPCKCILICACLQVTSNSSQLVQLKKCWVMRHTELWNISAYFAEYWYAHTSMLSKTQLILLFCTGLWLSLSKKKPCFLNVKEKNSRTEHVCPEKILLQGMSTLPNAAEISGLLPAQVAQTSDPA